MKTNWKVESPILAVLVVMWGVTAWAWPRATDHIPVHFNLAGEADRFGSRAEGLLILPFVTLFLYAMSAAWPRIDPRGEGFALFARPYAIVRFGLMTLMLAIYAALVAAALGRPLKVQLMPAALGIIVALLGNYLPKTQPNWLFGVRTPWTLSSDLSWRRTHRLAGPLLVLSGAVAFVMAFVRPNVAVSVLVGAIVTTAIICFIYSYLVWRRDPARGKTTSGVVS
jgi:uncharacterized membrane protein